jgi:hypothetical protein
MAQWEEGGQVGGSVVGADALFIRADNRAICVHHDLIILRVNLIFTKTEQWIRRERLPTVDETIIYGVLHQSGRRQNIRGLRLLPWPGELFNDVVLMKYF